MTLSGRAVAGGPRQPVVLTDNPITSTSDGELWTTVTERENDVWVTYFGSLAATTYLIMVSLTNPAFPHILQGQPQNRIDVTSLYAGLDLAANTKGDIKYGIITRIDGTNSDIKYFFNIPFLTGAASGSVVYSLRGVPSQVKTDFTGGVLQHGLTNDIENNVAGVNTAGTLNGPLANITPGLGDFIIKVVRTSGTVILSQGVFYHSH